MFQNIYTRAKEIYDKNNLEYHNWDHISSCFKEFRNVEDFLMCPRQVELAILFHDIVYEPVAEDNEEKSAKLMKRVLMEEGFLGNFMDRVSDLIINTKHDAILTDNDSKYMVDIDLSVLGKSPEEYDKYARAIREEFSMFPRIIYNQGRIGVLSNFLDKKTRPKIFQTEFFRDLYEANARRNVSEEIKRLKL
jgi:predicted metal-dependent HD superfamily phosphohydrolase